MPGVMPRGGGRPGPMMAPSGMMYNHPGSFPMGFAPYPGLPQMMGNTFPAHPSSIMQQQPHFGMPANSLLHTPTKAQSHLSGPAEKTPVAPITTTRKRTANSSNSKESKRVTLGNIKSLSKRQRELSSLLPMLNGERRLIINFDSYGEKTPNLQTCGKNGNIVIPHGIVGSHTAYSENWKFEIYYTSLTAAPDALGCIPLMWKITNLTTNISHTRTETPTEAKMRMSKGRTISNRVFREALEHRAKELERELAREIHDCRIANLQSRIARLRPRKFSEGSLIFGLQHRIIQEKMQGDLFQDAEALAEAEAIKNEDDDPLEEHENEEESHNGDKKESDIDEEEQKSHPETAVGEEIGAKKMVMHGEANEHSTPLAENAIQILSTNGQYPSNDSNDGNKGAVVDRDAASLGQDLTLVQDSSPVGDASSVKRILLVQDVPSEQDASVSETMVDSNENTANVTSAVETCEMEDDVNVTKQNSKAESESTVKEPVQQEEEHRIVEPPAEESPSKAITDEDGN